MVNLTYEQSLEMVRGVIGNYTAYLANPTRYYNTAEDIAKKVYDERGNFISLDDKPSYFTWLSSKGTNITCYAEYLSGISNEDNVGNVISMLRTIVYACAKPLQSQFCYWTLLLLILHKFNFKKPVMKIILAHYILRSIGDILDQLSNLMGQYFVSNGTAGCKYTVGAAEEHPLRWLLTRQIGCIFWYLGEICGDWYPLLRTRAVARDQKSMIWVYMSCGLFNLSKIFLFIMQFFKLPASSLYIIKEVKDLGGQKQYVYNEDKKDSYYNFYWVTIAVIIICSLIYDMTVYLVLKKQIFKRSKNEFGFLKKFRTISEYRIIVSVLICIIFLPVILLTIGFKFYFLYGKKYSKLNFSFEDIRTLIVNVQYFMIFIDQIMLFRSRDDSMEETTAGGYNSNNFSSNNFSSNNNSNQLIKPYNIDSKLYYTNLNTLNNSIQNTAQSNLMQYNYANNVNSNNMNYGRSNNYSTRNNTIANYDDFNGTGNEWSYLRR